MDAEQLEEALRVFESSLSQIKWRLKPSSKSRLQTGYFPFSSSHFSPLSGNSDNTRQSNDLPKKKKQNKKKVSVDINGRI